MGGSSRKARSELVASVAAWAATYFVAHILGIAFADPVRRVATVWPASGVMLAALLASPRSRWPLLLAVLGAIALSTNVILNGAAPMNLGFLAANIAESSLSAWVVSRVVRRDVTFTRIEEVLALGAAAVVVNGATAFIGAAAPAVFAGAPFWPSYRSWWSSNLVGIVLVTPLVIAWVRPSPLARSLPPRKVETAVFALAWCAGTWLTTHTPDAGGPLAPRRYMLICLVTWAALRLSLRTVSSAMCFLGAAVVSGTLPGALHSVNGGTVADSVMRAQIYVAVSTVTSLLLAATMTEARAARASADRSAAHLKFALDASHMGTWEWDVASNSIHWSEQVRRIFGVTPESFSGSYEDYLALIHPDDRENVSSTIQRALDPASAGYTVEHRIVRSDGTTRWLECRGRVERDPTGKPLRMAGTVVDVTEQQQVAERLRQTQKMEAIGQLAGGVAHDFNNLLAVILMQAEIAEKSRTSGEPERLALREIAIAAERGAALTKQLLAFARRQVPQPKPIDLNSAVRDVTTMLGRLLGDTTKMRIELASRELVTRVDPSMLDQVLINLAVNARDAMPAGGELVIATVESVVKSEGDDGIPPGSYLGIRVTDSGVGIAARDMPRLFEPFFTTKGPGKGTGLGLATVFGIMKLHHGYVRVTSEVGRGSTFEVLFPPCDEPVAAATARTEDASAPKGKETILLVEDDASVRKTTRMLLEMHDYAVIEAKNGGEALELWDAREGRIDLLFTDVTMPDGLDGRQLAVELRRRRPDLKVVLTSGYSPHIPSELPPGERFLMKPSTLPELLDAVDGALRA